MDEIRRFVRWTVPGTMAILWAVTVATIPTLVANFGRRSTPLPDLVNATGAEAAMIAVFGLVLGVVIDAIAHVIPSIVVRSGLVRWDMPAEVLRLPAVLARAQALDPSFPAQDLLTAAKAPFRRSADPATGRWLVYRLTSPLLGSWKRAPRDIRRAWRLQVERNAGLLKDVLATLTSETGKELNLKYLSLTDRYRSMGSCRVAVALGGITGLIRILGYQTEATTPVQAIVSATIAIVMTCGVSMFFSKARADLLMQRRRVVVHRFELAVRSEASEPTAPDQADPNNPDPLAPGGPGPTGSPSP